jgi:hypothetical protein
MLQSGVWKFSVGHTSGPHQWGTPVHASSVRGAPTRDLFPYKPLTYETDGMLYLLRQI